MLSLLAGAAAARTSQLSRLDKALNAVLAEVESFERGDVSPEHVYKDYFNKDGEGIMPLVESFDGCVAAVINAYDLGTVVDYTAGEGESCRQTEKLKDMYSELYVGDKWVTDPEKCTDPKKDCPRSFPGFGRVVGEPIKFGDEKHEYFTMQLKKGDKCSVVGHSEWYVLVVADIPCGYMTHGMGQVGLKLQEMIEELWGPAGW